MRYNKTIPIIITEQLEKVKEFYTKLLNFSVTFDHPEYLALKHKTNSDLEVGFMKPQPGQAIYNSGLFLGFDVTDVDAEYKRLIADGAIIFQPLSDKPWGDRSFAIQDPIGVTLYFCTPIEPSGEFKKYFK
ncbi:MAG: VOC family protein [Deltaproteobacteria bacterium]|nr:VOC family protein [Deltaproteobacteria bacterium]